MTSKHQSATGWRSDARQYGRIMKKGGWWLAYLAARCVVEDNGHGVTRDGKRDDRPICSLREFAEEAGTSHHRVKRHLEAWDRATEQGVVPPRFTFVGRPEINVPMPDDEDDPFDGYYSAVSDSGRNVRDPNVRAALIASANAAGVGASKVLDVSSNKKAVVAAVKADPALAAAIAKDIDATLAVTKERQRLADDQGIRDPAELERERERKRLAQQGPGLVEVMELGMLALKARDLANKFVTPEDGPGRYTDTARIQIETGLTQIRAACQHIEDVMNGDVDTRIPNDLSGLVTE